MNTSAATSTTTAEHTEGLPVRVQGLSKTFDGRSVIANLGLTVAPGSFVAIVGRSGSGKSTLLRLIAGLEQPDAGRILFGEESRRPPVRLMFQEPRLLPWASVAANVAIGLGATGDEKRDRTTVDDALRSVGLADRAEVWPSTLSGGQKQRVALARALVSKPRLLALDEPFGALDALTRIEMQDLVTRIHTAQRFTATLVTHDVAEAVALADRVVVLENGGIGLDLGIDVPRGERRGSPQAAALEGRILDRLLGRIAA